MASRMLDRKNAIIFGVVVLLSLAGNVWMSHEVKKMEETAVTSSSPDDNAALTGGHKEVYGIPRIDPDNDPLAPVLNLASQKSVPKDPVSSQPSLPVYEPPADSEVLVQ